MGYWLRGCRGLGLPSCLGMAQACVPLGVEVLPGVCLQGMWLSENRLGRWWVPCRKCVQMGACGRWRQEKGNACAVLCKGAGYHVGDHCCPHWIAERRSPAHTLEIHSLWSQVLEAAGASAGGVLWEVPEASGGECCRHLAGSAAKGAMLSLSVWPPDERQGSSTHHHPSLVGTFVSVLLPRVRQHTPPGHRLCPEVGGVRRHWWLVIGG
jgi:hypothetical protein